MSGHRKEDGPRTLKLTRGVRLHGDQIAIDARVFQGSEEITREEVFLSVDDASVMNAQLTRLLDERVFPGMQEREKERSRQRWGH